MPGARSRSAIRYADRVLMVGTTGCGKSTVARRMFLSVAAPRLVIDPADSLLTELPGAVTFSDARRRLNERGEDWRAAATARFVPTDPEDVDAYDAVYRWCFDRFPRYVWCDEAADALPVKRAPSSGRRYLTQGRKRQLGHLACSTRPRDIDRNLFAQAQHILIWRCANVEDFDHVAKQAGTPPAVLAQLLGELPEHGFVWFDQRAMTLTACPPMRP